MSVVVEMKNGEAVSSVSDGSRTEAAWKTRIRDTWTNAKEHIQNAFTNISNPFKRCTNDSDSNSFGEDNSMLSYVRDYVSRFKELANERYGEKFQTYKQQLILNAKEIKKESKEYSFMQMMVGEFFGSFIMLLFVSGAGFYASPPSTELVMRRSLTSGLVYTLLLFSFRSNCHFNLPLSVCLCFMQRISKHCLFVHGVCQFGGCFTGCIFLSWISSCRRETSAYVADVSVADGVLFLDVIFIEFVCTFIFVFVALFCFPENSSKEDQNMSTFITADQLIADQSFSSHLFYSASINSMQHSTFPLSNAPSTVVPPIIYQAMEGLIAGITLTSVSMFAIPFTGCSINPLRSLSLALIMNSWSHLWIYLSAPMAGGLLSGFAYNLFFNHQFFLRYFKKCKKCFKKHDENDDDLSSNSYKNISDNIDAEYNGKNGLEENSTKKKKKHDKKEFLENDSKILEDPASNVKNKAKSNVASTAKGVPVKVRLSSDRGLESDSSEDVYNESFIIENKKQNVQQKSAETSSAKNEKLITTPEILVTKPAEKTKRTVHFDIDESVHSSTSEESREGLFVEPVTDQEKEVVTRKSITFISDDDNNENNDITNDEGDDEDLGTNKINKQDIKVIKENDYSKKSLKGVDDDDEEDDEEKDLKKYLYESDSSD